MNFKKRVNGSWTDIPYYVHDTDTDTITTLPAVIHPTGTTATVGLKGQAVQSSVPSPTSPIMPQRTGERTGNLFLSNWERGVIDSSGVDIPSANGVRTKNYIPVTPNTIYSISRNIATSYINLRFYNNNKQYINYGTSSNVRLISGNSEGNPMAAGIGFCCFEIIDTNIKYMRINDNSNDTSTKYMMVEGQYTASTMPAYEPYGYKIPISSANTTTPVYLGEVQTTRRVKKLVLTGDETLTSGSVIGQIRTSLTGAIDSLGLCTHYILKTSYGGAFPYIRIRSNTLWFEISPDGYETKEEALADFKSYLAQQYANGTPVTIWYVLATEETAVVNEPLMKIGNYADSLSNVSIPVTAGANTISVDTTLQPSEVTVNYKGWHPVTDVHERENGAWT